MREEPNTPDTGERPPKPAPPAAGRDYYPHSKNSVGKTVRSLVFAHLGGVLIALVICFALVPMMTGAGLILTIPVTLLVYIGTIYGTLWGMGHDDANLANFGHITLDRWRGLKMYALAMAPFYAFCLFFFICWCLNVPWFMGLAIAYKVINAQIWPVINAFQVLSARADIVLWQAALMAVLPLVGLPFSQLAYYLGTKDFSVMQKLVYKNKKKKKRGPRPPKSQYTPSR